MIARHIGGALGRTARAPVSTSANVLTLALGLAAFILAWGVVSYWRSSDSHFAASERIMVMTEQLSQKDGDGSGAVPTTAEPLGKYLHQDFPELEAVARLRTIGEASVNTGDRTVMLHGAYAEPDLLKIFDFKFLAGDPVRALEPSDAIVLTQASAEKLFGGAPALGRRVTLNGKYDVTVTGVIAPIRQPSHMGEVDDPRVDYISAWPKWAENPREIWLSLQFTTYALLPADGSLTANTFRQRLAQYDERRVPAEQREIAAVAFGAIPISELLARRLDVELFGELSGRLSVIHVLFGLGIMVLAVACLNYANLATAHAISRAKQIAMRRMLGASHGEIVVQSLVELALLTAASFVLALVMCWLAAPVIKTQTGIDLATALFRNPGFIGVAAALVPGVAIAAGAYPAFVLTRVRPADAVRSGKTRSTPRLVSQTLVGLQFATASILLIAVIVLGQQNAFLQQAGANHGSDPVVTFGPPSLTGVPARQLAERLRSRPEIKQVGEMDHLPWTNYSNVMPLSRTAAPGAAEKTPMVTGVGFGFFETFGFKVLAGRVYDEARDKGASSRWGGAPPQRNPAPATEPIVIDRTLSEALGFASPQAAVGKTIHVGASIARVLPYHPPLEIIGVVENMPQHFMGAGTDGNAYGIDDGAQYNFPVVRIALGQETRALAALREAWDSLSPQRPFNPALVRDLFDQGFTRFAQTSGLFQGLSLLAFLISAMGLFGMAVHVIQRRRHEIGVRKTLGATALRVVTLLIRDFSRPVVIANLLAWPIAYVAAQAYLSSFMRRVDLTLAPFVLSFAITLAIAWVVVGAQTIRAANLHPADVLRRG